MHPCELQGVEQHARGQREARGEEHDDDSGQRDGVLALFKSDERRRREGGRQSEEPESGATEAGRGWRYGCPSRHVVEADVAAYRQVPSAPRDVRIDEAQDDHAHDPQDEPAHHPAQLSLTPNPPTSTRGIICVPVLRCEKPHPPANLHTRIPGLLLHPTHDET